MVTGASIYMRGLFIKVGKYAVIVHRYGGVLRRNFRNVEDVGCVELRYESYFLLSVASFGESAAGWRGALLFALGGGMLFALGGELLEFAHAVTVLCGGYEVE